MWFEDWLHSKKKAQQPDITQVSFGKSLVVGVCGVVILLSSPMLAIGGVSAKVHDAERYKQVEQALLGMAQDRNCDDVWAYLKGGLRRGDERFDFYLSYLLLIGFDWESRARSGISRTEYAIAFAVYSLNHKYLDTYSLLETLTNQEHQYKELHKCAVDISGEGICKVKARRVGVQERQFYLNKIFQSEKITGQSRAFCSVYGP
ncbi:hypothetical protein ACC717_05870 [Rhizobium ruizarguesonis]